MLSICYDNITVQLLPPSKQTKAERRVAEVSTLRHRFANCLVSEGQSPYSVLVWKGHKPGPKVILNTCCDQRQMTISKTISNFNSQQHNSWLNTQQVSHYTYSTSASISQHDLTVENLGLCSLQKGHGGWTPGGPPAPN